MNSCCSLHCSERAVCLTSCSFNAVYGFSTGGHTNRSITSAANSGDREATTLLNFDIWEVMRQQANCASTCTNQILGSAGQKGGGFRQTCPRRLTLSRDRGWAEGLPFLALNIGTSTCITITVEYVPKN